MSIRQMPLNDHRQPNPPPRVKRKVVQNDNRGSGAFYQGRVQNIYHYYGEPPSASDPSTLSVKGEHDNIGLSHLCKLEPYQTIIDVLFRIREHVLWLADSRFDCGNTIAGFCDELDELASLVGYVAMTINHIGQVFPLMFKSPFVSRAQHSAFTWSARLKMLERDAGTLAFKAYRDQFPTAEMTTREWSSLLLRVRTCIRGPRADMTQFLRIIAASQFFQSFGVKKVELWELITRLSLTRGLHSPSVDTIWVREPTGMRWFSIPLKFCETWKEFSTVIYEYCRNGPEREYIRQGDWAIVCDADNSIIDQTRFTGVLKPEMRFDIGVIVRIASLLAGTCPQCGHQNDGSNSVDGWVHCSNIECANLFRTIFQPPPKVPDDKSRKTIATKSICSWVLSIIKNRAKSLFKGRISSSTRMQHLSTKFHRMLANVPHSPLEDDKGEKARAGGKGIATEAATCEQVKTKISTICPQCGDLIDNISANDLVSSCSDVECRRTTFCRNESIYSRIPIQINIDRKHHTVFINDTLDALSSPIFGENVRGRTRNTNKFRRIDAPSSRDTQLFLANFRAHLSSLHLTTPTKGCSYSGLLSSIYSLASEAASS